MWYSESPGGRARKALAGTNPPKVDDVKQWAHFLHTKEGGGYNWKWANNDALEVLAEDHPPKLDDVKELAQHFNSTDTRWYSAEGSGSPGGRARKALAGTNPPKVDDVKQWAHFLHTKEGGGYNWKWANIRALEVLAEDHPPKLDDVKELAQHFALGFQDTVQPEAEPTRPVETTPEPLQMLDCDPPAKPRYGDLTGHVCKEGQSKIQHGQRCSPVCSLGHAPQPATLICDNGVIGSFECPEDIDNLSF